MRKQYLWVDRRGADLRWPALGNVNLGAGARGTLALWVRPREYRLFWNDPKLWSIYCDANNQVNSHFGRSLEVRSGGTWYRRSVNDINRHEVPGWEIHFIQWDFAAGMIRSYYNDAAPVIAPLTGVPAPQGSPQWLSLGYPYADPITWADDDLLIHGVAIWDDLMSTAQMSALYQQGHLHEISAEEGTGNLTFLLRLNEHLNAEIAPGGGSCTPGATTPVDRWCLLDEGVCRPGLASYPLGLPRHDGSADDRKPLGAVCKPHWDTANQRSKVVVTNLTAEGRLKVTGFADQHFAGTAFPQVPVPGTYRQLIHVPNEGNRKGYTMGVGPVAYRHFPSAMTGVFDGWGSGRTFTVQADGGNSASSFKTNLDSKYETGYWVGAYVHFFSGPLMGHSAQVTGYDATTRVLTLAGSLPATPAAGQVGWVNGYPRLIGQWHSDGNLMPEYTLEANLWWHHETQKQFLHLEWQSNNLLRYGRGRTAALPGSSALAGRKFCYGKFVWQTDDPPTELEIWLRKIEIGGPQRYQLLARDAQGRGPSLADNFMVLTRDYLGNPGDSTKVWRKQGLSRHKRRPVKNPSVQQATADLQAPGTWRQTVVHGPVAVSYEETTQTVLCALGGRDAAGVERLGYVEGRWDPQTGRITWTDETPPPGRSNPVLELNRLRVDAESDAPTAGQRLLSVVPAPDGTWSLLYWAFPVLADMIQTYALHGAPDRWSFDAQAHFAGPVLPMQQGTDTRDPLSGNGFAPWVNHHQYGVAQLNPWAQTPQDKYLFYAGGKTNYNHGPTYSLDVRPIIGARGADLRSLAPLPHGNQVSPLPGSVIHHFRLAVLGQADCVGILCNHGFTTGLGLQTSEDGIHFQELYAYGSNPDTLLQPGELADESFQLTPGDCFRLADQRVYYYDAGGGVPPPGGGLKNYAAVRYNGETWYQLESSGTQGWLETPIVQRPPGGWGDLTLNADPAGGAVRVELRDPAIERPLAGWGAGDCDPVADAIEGRVTWAGRSLTEQTADYLRLRIYLERPDAQAATPELYAWAIAPYTPATPTVGDLQVEGAPAPAGVRVTQPRLSWSYQHPEGRAQEAWQVQVASSAALLSAGTPDMWDSGVVLGAQNETPYAGAPLADQQTYFWRVRARSTEGVWSESW